VLHNSKYCIELLEYRPTTIQERTKSITNELEDHSQQRPTKDGAQLRESRGGSSWQMWMATECGPVCPHG